MSAMFEAVYSQDKGGCVDLLKRMLALMSSEPGLALTPPVYAVLFEHLSGQNPALSAELKRQRAGSLHTSMLTALYFKHIAMQSNHCDESARRFRLLMQKATDVADETSKASRDYETQLDDLANALQNGATVSELRPRLDRVTHSTLAMRKATQAMGNAASNSLSEIEALQQELSKARLEAVTDPLSQLLNRRGLQQVVNDVFANQDVLSSRPCLVVLDIDHFKKVNDTFGHQTGDSVIHKVADIVRSHLPEGGYGARVGGEEFFVLLEDADIEQAHVLAERIRKTAESSMTIRDRKTGQTVSRVTLSAGVAQLREGEDFASLERRADGALYAAKRHGRNQVQIDQKLAA